MEGYYREKLVELINKLFVNTGDVKDRLINNEMLILLTMSSCPSDENHKEIKEFWKSMWNDLNKENPIKYNDRVIFSSFHQTIKKKRRKSLEKYLHFFLEEFYRLV